MTKTKNRPIAPDTIKKIIGIRQASPYFSGEEAEEIHRRLTEDYHLTEQDVMLYAMAHPRRLTDLIHNFILYDKGIKKVARYQQYFAVKKAMINLKTIRHGRRQGEIGRAACRERVKRDGN